MQGQEPNKYLLLYLLRAETRIRKRKLREVRIDLSDVEGVNRGMQIRRSVLFFGPIRRSDFSFVQIRIRITLNFPWYKYAAHGYVYLFCFSCAVFRFYSTFSAFADV